MQRGPRRRRVITIGVLLGTLLLPAMAFAHLERPSYWPDPAPDRSVTPAAGGKVPKLRSLSSAVGTLRRRVPAVAGTAKGREKVRVVCEGSGGAASLRALRASVAVALRRGYRIRPSQGKLRLTHKQARKLLRINLALADKCRYHQIQPAVFDSNNNDRVVIMPGRYTEPRSRRQPLNDPRCAGLTQRDSSGAETPSYRYQVTCPNDQNLVYVQGRRVPPIPPPEPPLMDRQGIPDLGPCVRCNLQLEGSGVSPTDVIVDGASGYTSDSPEARPRKLHKHVVIRADRADGLVVHNLTARGALEHGIYIEETDGYRLDTVKMFWAADYGNLTFTSDHGLYTNCDGLGAGDAVVYPGAAPETGEQADLAFYRDAPRINTVVKNCDMRGSVLAYSGSMGNAVRITKNHIYGNQTGISTDTISASGHPGYPADSVKIDHNYIYSNNLNLYTGDNPPPPVEPVIGVPIGAGVIWPGHNNGKVHDNWIFDNWRYGALLLAIPDFVVTPEGNVDPGVSCQMQGAFSTSCNNRYFDNHMGRKPKGFEFPSAINRFDVAHGDLDDKSMPNGTDFWWDEQVGSTGNCWFDNTGSDGTAASITGPGAGEPPDDLPSDCATSSGSGDGVKFGMLVDCSTWEQGQTGADHPACEWFQMPPEPGTAAARREARDFKRVAARYADSPEADRLRENLESSIWAQSRP